MYLLAVVLLMALLPISSIGLDHFLFQRSVPIVVLVGKWFVFWAAGARSFLAGVRQLFQPRFTAEKIFGLTSSDALPFVRELGVANLATGTVGMLSLVKPSFVPPIAIVAAIFYGIAGVRHLTEREKNLNQNVAMITDILVSLVFIAYIGSVGPG